MAKTKVTSDSIEQSVVETLDRLLELEMAGVVRYTHYSFMIFGFNRIPITGWMRDQANESLRHAHLIGELITHFNHHPTLKIGQLLETHKHDIRDILEESLEHEAQAIKLYHQLLSQTEGKSVLLEEFARQMIQDEELHRGEIEKMLKKPGDL